MICNTVLHLWHMHMRVQLLVQICWVMAERATLEEVFDAKARHATSNDLRHCYYYFAT